MDTTERLAQLRQQMQTAQTAGGEVDLDAYVIYYGDEHMVTHNNIRIGNFYFYS